jgi:hypothetical protein
MLKDTSHSFESDIRQLVGVAAVRSCLGFFTAIWADVKQLDLPAVLGSYQIRRGQPMDPDTERARISFNSVENVMWSGRVGTRAVRDVQSL